MEKTKLEEINPARSAQIGLVWYRIVFALVFLVEGGWFVACLTGRPGAVQFAIPALIAILVTILIYNWATRTAIAPLMTWHYAKQNAECAQRILEHLRAQSPRPAARTVPPPRTARVVAKPAHGVTAPTAARPSQPKRSTAPEPATVPCPSCGSPIPITPGAKAVSCPACGKTFGIE